MKRFKVLFAAFMVFSISVTVIAWGKNKATMKPHQRVALWSLGNRYLDAACSEPRALLDAFQGSIIPQTMLDKSADYLDSLVFVQGECFGNNKDEIQFHMLKALDQLTEALNRNNMGTEFMINDFYDCLVEVERRFTDLRNSSREIFTCIDNHLDIRGVWYEIFARKPEVYYPPAEPIEPVIVTPIDPYPVETCPSCSCDKSGANC